MKQYINKMVSHLQLKMELQEGFLSQTFNHGKAQQEAKQHSSVCHSPKRSASPHLLFFFHLEYFKAQQMKGTLAPCSPLLFQTIGQCDTTFPAGCRDWKPNLMTYLNILELQCVCSFLYPYTPSLTSHCWLLWQTPTPL